MLHIAVRRCFIKYFELYFCTMTSKRPFSNGLFLFPLHARTSQLLRRLLVPASQPRSRIVETRINHRFISFLLALSASRRKNRRLEDFYLLTQQWEPKNPSRETWIFSFVSAGHNIIWPKVNIIMSVANTSFLIQADTNERGCADGANDVLRNDVTHLA